MQDYTINMDDLDYGRQQALRRLQQVRKHVPEVDAVKINGWVRYGSNDQYQAAFDLLKKYEHEIQPINRPTPIVRINSHYGPWVRREERPYYSWQDPMVYWTRSTPWGTETSYEDPAMQVDPELLAQVRANDARRPRHKRKDGSGRKPQPAKPLHHNF